MQGNQRYPHDLTGCRFGKLTVAGMAGSRRTGSNTVQLYRCICDCGGETIVRRDALVSGHTQSCGCMRTTHGANERREQALALLGQGMSQREAAEEMGVSNSTVSKYKLEAEDAGGMEPLYRKMEKKPDLTSAWYAWFAPSWTEAVNRIRRHSGMAELPMSWK